MRYYTVAPGVSALLCRWCRLSTVNEADARRLANPPDEHGRVFLSHDAYVSLVRDAHGIHGRAKGTAA